MDYKFSIQEEKISKILRDTSFYANPLSRDVEKGAKWILMAPPNLTGIVHLGHVWDFIIPDFYSRFFHIVNEDVIFVPGKDHAGIATQVKVEESIRATQDIQKLTTKAKLSFAQKWVKKYGEQAECVWDTFAISCNKHYLKYTLDLDIQEIIINIFIDYFNKGLIYLDNKIINWDLKLKTAISNEEIIHKNEKSKLYYVKYQFKNKNGFLTIATTRPETIFSDVCLFVNPKNKTIPNNTIVLNPLTNKKLHVLYDNYVDVNFGSGILKCTPQHDINDFELYKKHHLELGKPSIGENGKMTKLAGKYYNMPILDARKKIVDDLSKKGLIESIEIINNEKAYSSRSNSLIEPLISKQWFFKVSSISKKAFESFLASSCFEPKYFNNKLRQWGEVLDDWCISRQLWWGLKLPIYYSKDNKYIASVKNPNKNIWTQVKDVFDTWFISGHWPIILNRVFKRKNKPFYCVGMGTDIFYAWAVRMILTQYEQNKKTPFLFCLFHGLLRDKDGRKMSKSLGNGIDPILEAKRESADAIRWALLSRNNYGYDLNYSKNMLDEAHSLIRKITSIVTFFELRFESKKTIKIKSSPKEFKMLINSLMHDIFLLWVDCKDLVSKHKLNLYCLKLRQFIINQISSNYINLLTHSNFSIKQYVEILHLLKILFQLIEPIMPIFHHFLQNGINAIITKQVGAINYLYNMPNSIIQLETKIRLNNTAKDFNLLNLVFLIKAKIRNLSKVGIKEFTLFKQLFLHLPMISSYLKLSKLAKVNLKQAIIKFNDASISLYWKENELALSMVKKQIEQTQLEIQRSEKILSNSNFVNKAPKDLVIKEQEKLKHYKKHLKILQQNLSRK